MKIMLVAIMLLIWIIGYAMYKHFERMDERLDELEDMIDEESALLRINLERVKSKEWSDSDEKK